MIVPTSPTVMQLKFRDPPVKEQATPCRLLPCGSGFCQTQELEPRFTEALARGTAEKAYTAIPTTTRSKHLQIGSFGIDASFNEPMGMHI
jgi:hypothetical protein